MNKLFARLLLASVALLIPCTTYADDITSINVASLTENYIIDGDSGDYVLFGKNSDCTSQIIISGTGTYNITLSGMYVEVVTGLANSGFIRVEDAATVNIIVEDYNTYTNNSNENAAFLYNCNSGSYVTISGEGDLHIMVEYEHGISNVHGTLEFAGATTYISCYATTNSVGIHNNYSDTKLIFSGGMVIISSECSAIRMDYGASTMEMTGGVLNINTHGDGSAGIYVASGGGVTISGGTLGIFTIGEGSYGIYTNCDLTITGGEIIIISDSANIYTIDSTITISDDVDTSNLTIEIQYAWVDGLYYYLSSDDSTATLMRYSTDAGTEVVIPSTITVGNKDYTVTTIGEFVHGEGVEEVTSLTLPSTITTIGDWAFMECWFSLKEVYVPWSNSTDLPTMGMDVFEAIMLEENNVVLYVPEDASSIYTSAEQWCKFPYFVEENAVAEAGNVQYTDFRTAFNSGCELVTLLDDVEVNSLSAYDITTEIALNGHNITSSVYLFRMVRGSTITISGAGNIISSRYLFMMVYAESTITINVSGKIDAIDFVHTFLDDATLNVISGTYTVDVSSYVDTDRAVGVKLSTCGMNTASSVDHALDLSTMVDASAYYIASANRAGTCVYTKPFDDDIVAANTGLLIARDADDVVTVVIPFTDEEGTAVDDNLLVASTGKTLCTSDDNGTNYVFGLIDDEVGFYIVGDSGYTLATGKAYLSLPGGTSSALHIGDSTGADEETTALNTESLTPDHLISQSSDLTIYNLAGQKVSAPSKGLYIQNGKKVLFN